MKKFWHVEICTLLVSLEVNRERILFQTCCRIGTTVEYLSVGPLESQNFWNRCWMSILTGSASIKARIFYLLVVVRWSLLQIWYIQRFVRLGNKVFSILHLRWSICTVLFTQEIISNVGDMKKTTCKLWSTLTHVHKLKNAQSAWHLIVFNKTFLSCCQVKAKTVLHSVMFERMG